MSETNELIWLGGNPGDGWYEMVERWLETISLSDAGITLSLRAGGGEQNLTDVVEGSGDLGMSIDLVAAAAYNGAPPFEKALRSLRTVGQGWSDLPYNLLAGAGVDGDFEQQVHQRTLRVGAPPKDTTDELVFQRVLDSYDIDYDAVVEGGGTVLLADYHSLVKALHDGDVDFVFGATTMPAPSIAAAAEGVREVELTSVPQRAIDYLVDRFGARPGTIPQGTYPGLQRGPVGTCFADTLVVVDAGLDDEVVAAVTRELLRDPASLPDVHPSLAGFNPWTAWRNVAVPMHPGAARAYRELGYLAS